VPRTKFRSQPRSERLARDNDSCDLRDHHRDGPSPLRRARLYGATRGNLSRGLSPKLEVHSEGETSADVTEGTSAGIGDNWERCNYDWSRSDSVMATVTESNVYAVPGSSWEIKATPSDGGSRVEMTWIREFKPNVRGRIFGTAFRLIGNRIFNKYGRQIVENLEKVEART
jgi:hypothetical protein